MFVAHESFEDPLMSALAEEGEHCYRGMHLSIRVPWFIVTCLLFNDELQMLRSICCACDIDLLELLKPGKGRHPVSLQQIAPSHEGDGRWEALQIERVWRVDHAAGHSILVFQDFDGTEFTNPFDDSPEERLGDRTLIFDSKPAAPYPKRMIDTPEPRVKVPLFVGDADPFSIVSASELAVQLKMSDQEVQRRAAAGHLFTVGPAAAGQARYPRYLALPTLDGGKLESLLAVLAQTDAHPQLFFTGECPELGLLSPVEALLGAAIRQRGFQPEAARITSSDPAIRFEYVLGAARAFVADTSGW